MNDAVPPTAANFRPLRVFPAGAGLAPLDVFEELAREVPVTMMRLGAAGGVPGRYTVLGMVAGTKTVPIEEYAAAGSLCPPTLADRVASSSIRSGARWLMPVPCASHSALSTEHSELRIGPGWFVALPYELGGVLEPACASRAASALSTQRSALPVVWQRIETALVHDTMTGAWSGFGEWEELLERARRGVAQKGGFALGRIDAVTNRDRFLANVSATLEYISAGDIYQANIAHEMRATFSGSRYVLAAKMFGLANPAHGCIASFVHEGAEHMLISCSPELFLAGNLPTREIVTRPMKGTRRADTNPGELERSIKDRAELAMIIDLMRNDLGRVCELGSVSVESARTIERHGEGVGGAGVLQATGTIRGVMREGTTLDALLRATFPGGSITGAPKIRAAQIIGELEGEPRGYYCGSMGYVADDGMVEMNVAIRTAHVQGEEFAFAVGAGIVADSDADAEWRETLDKAWILGHLTEMT